MFITEPISPPRPLRGWPTASLPSSPYTDAGLVSVDAESDELGDVRTEVSIRLEPAFAADDHNWEFVFATTDNVLRELGLSDQVPVLMTMQPQHQAAGRHRQEVTAL